MLVSVLYYNTKISGYAGREYIYKTELPIKLFQKVIAPVPDGKKKALVVDINLPESSVDSTWANKIQEITEIDKGDEI